MILTAELLASIYMTAGTTSLNRIQLSVVAAVRSSRLIRSLGNATLKCHFSVVTLSKDAGSLCHYLHGSTNPDWKKKNDTETTVDRKSRIKQRHR